MSNNKHFQKIDEIQPGTGRMYKEDGSKINLANILSSVFDAVNNVIKVKADGASTSAKQDNIITELGNLSTKAKQDEMITALKNATEASVDTGIATGGSINTLTDTTKNFTTNMWQLALIEVIIDGVNYLRNVISNTANTLTINTLPGNPATAVVGDIAGAQVTVVTVANGGNDYEVEVVAGVGNNVLLSAALVGDVLTVTLATDGAGVLDDTANTATAVAGVIDALPEFTATMTGAGGVMQVTASPVVFSGGVESVEITAGTKYQLKLPINVTNVIQSVLPSGASTSARQDLIIAELEALTSEGLTANYTTTAVTLTTTAVTLGTKAGRIGMLIVNEGSVNSRIGKDTLPVGGAGGYPLYPGNEFPIKFNPDNPVEVYGCAASATCVVTLFQWFEEVA